MTVIYAYTREMAIDDGTLVDVSSTAKEAGIRFPVALTRAVWCRYVEIPDGVEAQDESGRLWDIVWMLRHAMKRCDGSHMTFELRVRNHPKRVSRVQLKAICGPGDNAEPVITVMLPDED